MRISVGVAADMGTARVVEVSWEAFAARLVAPPTRGRETMAEFHAMDRDAKGRLKAANWYVGGPSVDGKRGKASFPERTLVTLDIDDATPAFLVSLARGNGTEYAYHTTRSSTPEHPRLRLIIPLREPIPSDLCARVTLGLKAKIDRPGVVVDGCSVDPNRLLYAPTLCADAPHVAGWCRGEFPDVAKLAAQAPPEAARPAIAPGNYPRADWRLVMEELGARIEPSPRYRGEFTTLCPWHSDTSPSLDISPDVGKMYCWSCRNGGTVVSYVMQVLGCTPKEAGAYIRSVMEFR